MKTIDYKNRAMEKLNKNWAQAIVIMTIIIVMVLLFKAAEFVTVNYFVLATGNLNNYTGSIISVIVEIVFFFIMIAVISPVLMGKVWWEIQLVRGRSNKISDIFVCCKSVKLYFKTAAIYSIKWFICLVVFLPFGLCVYAVKRISIIIYNSSSENGAWVILLICSSVLSICMLAFYFAVTVRFGVMPYAYALNPDKKVFEIFLTAVRMNNNCIYGFSKLILSFIWWLIPMFFVFPIFFVFPYFSVTFAEYVNEVLADSSNFNTAHETRELHERANNI